MVLCRPEEVGLPYDPVKEAQEAWQIRMDHCRAVRQYIRHSLATTPYQRLRTVNGLLRHMDGFDDSEAQPRTDSVFG